MADPTVVQNVTGTSTTASTAASFSAATAGNLLLLMTAADDYRTGSPSGWTQVNAEVQTYHGLNMWYKIASGGETSVTYVIGSATRSVWKVIEFNNVSAFGNGAGAFEQVSGGSYATPTLTPSSGRKLIVAAVGRSTTSTSETFGDPSWATSTLTGAGSSTGPTENPNISVSAGWTVADFTGSSTIASTASGTGTAQAKSAIIASFAISAGGTNYTPSATDGVGATDSIASVQGFARTAADTVAVSDAVGITQAFVRSITDPVGVSDSATFSKGGGSTANFPSDLGWSVGSASSDNTAALNVGTVFALTAAANINGVRFYSPVSQGSVAAQLWADGTKVAEVTGQTMSAGWNTINFSSAYAGSTGVDYTVSILMTSGTAGYTSVNGRFSSGGTPIEVVVGPARSFITGNGRYTYGTGIPSTNGSDGTWFGVDAVLDAIPASLTASATDPIGTTDSINIAQGLSRSATEPVGLSDSATFQPGFALSFTVTDAVGITDLAAQQSIDSALDQVDPVGLSDSATLDVGRISTDLVGLTDSIAGTQAFARAASDLVGLVDSASFNLAAAGAITGADLVGLTDSLATSQSLVRSVSDPVGIGDSGSFALGAVASGTDPVGLSDSGSFVLVQAGNVQAADLVALADSLATARDYARVLTDIVGVTDSASFTIGMVISAPDQLGISDTATFAVDHGVIQVTATDPVAIGDGLVTALASQRGFSDTIGVSDSAVFLIPKDWTARFGRAVMGGREQGNLIVIEPDERQYIHWPAWGLIGVVPQIEIGGAWVSITLDTTFTPPEGWTGDSGAEWWRVLVAGPQAQDNPSGTLVVSSTTRIRKRVVGGDEIDILPDDRSEWVRVSALV